MRTRTLSLLLCAFVAMAASAADCPSEKPLDYEMAMVFAGCQGAPSCPDGVLLAINLVPLPGGGFPPAPWTDGYEIQACDEVTWNFGDGSPAVVKTGEANVAHAWAVPGNYRITATVRNALGTAEVVVSRVMAKVPAIIDWPVLPDVPEPAPSLTIPMRRTGDTTRRVSARLRVWEDPYAIGHVLHAHDQEVVFEPGQTLRNVTLPLFDNKLYDGRRQALLVLHDPQGGTLVRPEQVWITDDEPQPTIACDNAAFREGDGGRWRWSFPCRLSAPLSTYLNLHGALWDGTATRNDYHWNSGGTQIRAGETSGTMSFEIFGDTEVEPDETLRFSVGPYGGIPSSPINGPDAILTILNDDAALSPRRYRGQLGTTATFTLYPGILSGDRVAAPPFAIVRSSHPEIASAPETVSLSADAVPLEVTLNDEGYATIEVDLGDRTVTADVEVYQARAVLAAPSSLLLPKGGTKMVALSLAPAHSGYVIVYLTSDANIIGGVPSSVVIPPAARSRSKCERSKPARRSSASPHRWTGWWARRFRSK